MLSKRCILRVWLVSKVIVSSFLLPDVVWGQVIPDGTTPTPNPGPCTPLCTVMGGITDSTGRNLFHSFEQFSLSNGETLTFDHSTTIRNIITRVTGGKESTINGIIRTNPASESNLFLLNPNGILFGPNGSLDIGGSFVATTADAIQFGDRGTFSATDTTSDPALLTVSPTAFLFAQVAPQPIVSQSSVFNFTTFSSGLGVPENKSLLLVGGDIILERSPTASFGSSAITVPGGRVELGGINGVGTIELIINGDNLSLTYPTNIPLANVSLNEAKLNLFNPFSRAGTIVITANDFDMEKSLLNSITLGPDNAGEILIQANNEAVLRSSTITSNTAGAGTGGNLTIKAGLLSLEDAGLNVITNAGGGDAGQITLVADEISLRDASFISSEAFGNSSRPAGDIGKIEIETETLSVVNQSAISISTNGDALSTETSGNLIIDANASVSLVDNSEITSETLGQRNAGSIRINTPSLAIDNSIISAAVNEEGSAVSDATGQGGTIAFDTQLLTLTNTSQVTTSTSGAGAAGAILLTGNSLRLDFQDNSEVAAATTGPGAGGTVLVKGPQAITLTGNGSLSTRSNGSGPAGNVAVRTNGQLRIQDGARVEVSGESTGNSGTLDIVAGTTVLNNGQLLASSQAGQDGNIVLRSQDALVLRNESLISAQAFNNANGGNIDIAAPFIIALFAEGPNGSDIQASAEDGNGGRITIQANSLFNIQENKAIAGNRTNDLDATSGTGIDGDVIITTLEVDPTQGTIILPSGLGTPNVGQGCQASGGSTGQFIASGRGGVAPNPYDPLSNDGIQEDIYPAGYATALQIETTEPTNPTEPTELTETNQPVGAKDNTPDGLIEAQGWGRNAEGDVILMAENPTYHSACQHTVAGG